MARLHLINGRTAQAVEELNQVQATQNQDAQMLLDMLNLETSLETLLANSKKKHDEKSQPLAEQQRASIFKLVSIYDTQGVPGKALKLLMQSHESAPDDLQILKRLAKYQLFYNLIPEAEANYLTLQKTMPDDQETREALQRIEELKEVPHF